MDASEPKRYVDLSTSANRVVPLLLAVIFSLSLACSASDDRDKQDKQAIEALVHQQYAAANAFDFDAWSSLFTEAGLQQQAFPGATDRSREGLRKLWESGERTTYTLLSVSDIAINGGDAAVTATFAVRDESGDPITQMIYGRRERLVKIEGAWKIDGQSFESPAVPRGTKVVPVTANEFSFAFDAAAMKSGEFAIELENIGRQTHQIRLWRIAPDLDIERWIRGAEFSLENIHVGTSVVAAGETVNVPFSSRLTPGRYVMVCSLPDTDDPARTLHSEKGMYGEFTVR